MVDAKAEEEALQAATETAREFRQLCRDKYEELRKELQARQSEFRRNLAQKLGIILKGVQPMTYVNVVERLDAKHEEVDATDKKHPELPTAAGLLQWKVGKLIKLAANSAGTASGKPELPDAKRPRGQREEEDGGSASKKPRIDGCDGSDSGDERVTESDSDVEADAGNAGGTTTLSTTSPTSSARGLGSQKSTKTKGQANRRIHSDIFRKFAREVLILVTRKVVKERGQSGKVAELAVDEMRRLTERGDYARGMDKRWSPLVCGDLLGTITNATTKKKRRKKEKEEDGNKVGKEPSDFENARHAVAKHLVYLVLDKIAEQDAEDRLTLAAIFPNYEEIKEAAAKASKAAAKAAKEAKAVAKESEKSGGGNGGKSGRVSKPLVHPQPSATAAENAMFDAALKDFGNSDSKLHTFLKECQDLEVKAQPAKSSAEATPETIADVVFNLGGFTKKHFLGASTMQNN